MKVLTIGDIHGRDNWKKFGDINFLLQGDQFDTDYDYYVFVGDYTDSYTESNTTILHNLKEIIKFKENYPDKVVLLLGNHDLQYLFDYKSNGCSGFRAEAYFDLHDLLNRNKDKFQVAFQIGNTLWTHAGIHDGWYKYEFPFTSVNIAEDLNIAFKQNEKSLYDVGFKRGGFRKQGGPFWADKEETYSKPLKGYNQIIGHTAVREIKSYKRYNNTLIYCDALENNKALEVEISDDKLVYKELEI